MSVSIDIDVRDYLYDLSDTDLIKEMERRKLERFGHRPEQTIETLRDHIEAGEAREALSILDGLVGSNSRRVNRMTQQYQRELYT